MTSEVRSQVRMRSPAWDNWIAKARAVRIEDEATRHGASSLTAAKQTDVARVPDAVAKTDFPSM